MWVDLPTLSSSFRAHCTAVPAVCAKTIYFAFSVWQMIKDSLALHSLLHTTLMNNNTTNNTKILNWEKRLPVCFRWILFLVIHSDNCWLCRQVNDRRTNPRASSSSSRGTKRGPASRPTKHSTACFVRQMRGNYLNNCRFRVSII